MNYPPLRPKPELKEKVQFNESSELSTYDALTNGFQAVRSELCGPQVIENSEKNYKLNSEKMRLAFLQSCQGLHAPLRIMHEKNVVQKTQRLPFLPSSNLALETLEGRDEFIDYDDYIFNDPEEGTECLAPPHMVMEKNLFAPKN